MGARAPRSGPKGLWWKSLVVAWLVLRILAALAPAAGARVPEEAGYPVLAVVWAWVWAIWRRPAGPDDQRHPWR